MRNTHEVIDSNPKLREFLRKIDGDFPKNQLAFNALNGKFKKENTDIDPEAAIELILVSEISAPRFSKELNKISQLIHSYSSLLEVITKYSVSGHPPPLATEQRMDEIEKEYLNILKEIFSKFFFSS
ncbi:MAG: hypothetical protein US18_C0035G0005 [Parcubacteria group bacterium GW2011_GWB1_36_5]|nr:MAG: hypothetical protein US18_C0035G0005 [Parcubacteria group bacterium GW2011_GWB1_36_5]